MATTTGCINAPLALLPSSPSPGCIAGWIVHVRDWMGDALSPLLHLEEHMVTQDQLIAMGQPALVVACLYAVGLFAARHIANRMAPRTLPAMSALASLVWEATPASLRARLRGRRPQVAG